MIKCRWCDYQVDELSYDDGLVDGWKLLYSHVTRNHFRDCTGELMQTGDPDARQMAGLMLMKKRLMKCDETSTESDSGRSKAPSQKETFCIFSS